MNKLSSGKDALLDLHSTKEARHQHRVKKRGSNHGANNEELLPPLWGVTGLPHCHFMVIHQHLGGFLCLLVSVPMQLNE